MNKSEKKLIKNWKKKMQIIQSDDLLLYHKKFSYLLFINHFSDYVTKYQNYDYLKKVLCIGCYHGHWVNRIDQQTNIKAFIVDQSPKLLTLSMHMYPHFSYQLMDHQHIPYKDKKFHYTIINIPLDALIDVESTFKEVYRVLKRKGQCICYIRRITKVERYLDLLNHLGFNNLHVTQYKSITVIEIKK
ncbi:class I SAM-dependent methyltransferase [Macrococcus sp. DPC7161]|uniref:class I SAM-dependent methyltransferase n=1 Tax=Macrococcus sp. DPC7161 TaxID=2507060 RepID=UPI0013E970F5|nr:methyltransferase domain-containing protein [Macrococcus sp. DPC7161]